MKIFTPIIMPAKIIHASGKVKTVCVTACLTAIGVPFSGFSVTGSLRKAHYLNILNKYGFSTRSRKSKIPKNATIGMCRKAIIKLNENALYFVVVNGNGYCHAIVLNNLGHTVVDTSPRSRDKRKIHSIHAITKLN